MSDSLRSHRRQPTRLPHPWDFPGKNTEVGCHFLLQCVKVKSLSHIRLFTTPWTAAYQAPLPKGFSRQDTGVGCHLYVKFSEIAYGQYYVIQLILLMRPMRFRECHEQTQMTCGQTIWAVFLALPLNVSHPYKDTGRIKWKAVINAVTGKL